MLPEIDLGGFELKTFGLFFALNFLAWGLVAHRRLRELDRPPDWAYEMVFVALAGGLVGSRLDYILQNYDSVKDDLFGAVFSGGGLVWFGGVIGGTVSILLWAWWRGFLGLALLDFCAVGLSLGYAIGRIGCQTSGDGDYGTASDLPWAMPYPDGTEPIATDVHPTPIYETLAMGLSALVLWNLRDRVRPGVLFALYLVIAGTERLLVELIRRNDSVVAGLTVAQLISIGMIVAGVGWLVRWRGQFEPRAAV
ncbi:MAG: prolipoprotein diacylglyceryl transferase [Thermoleophilaceae bacterium]